MDLRVVFLRNDASFISQVIVWFTQRRRVPQRRCSHVLIKFNPGGVFMGDWVALEAMERGVWLSPYEISLGKQTVVAEFKVMMDEEAACAAIRTALNRYLSWYYDYTGIGIWALWILVKRWFATPLHWLKVVFNPGKAGKALFCSGLVRNVLVTCEGADPFFTSHMGTLTPRETTPQDEIDICFRHPEHYKYLGGVSV